MANVSKNFQSRPPEAPISTAMVQGGGGQSAQMYEPDSNSTISKNFAEPGNSAVSKNFSDAAKAARAADKVQNSATHRVLRGKW